MALSSLFPLSLSCSFTFSGFREREEQQGKIQNGKVFSSPKGEGRMCSCVLEEAKQGRRQKQETENGRGIRYCPQSAYTNTVTRERSKIKASGYFLCEMGRVVVRQALTVTFADPGCISSVRGPGWGGFLRQITSSMRVAGVAEAARVGNGRERVGSIEGGAPSHPTSPRLESGKRASGRRGGTSCRRTARGWEGTRGGGEERRGGGG